MSTYGLLEHFDDTENPELLKKHKALNDGSNYVAQDVFKDTRLNKLWAKAELAGFTRKRIIASRFYYIPENFIFLIEFIFNRRRIANSKGRVSASPR